MTNAVHQSAPPRPPVSTGRLVAGTTIAGGAGTGPIKVGEALGEDPVGEAYRGELRTAAGHQSQVLIQVLDPGLPVYDQAQWDRLCQAVAVVAGLEHKALLPVLELRSQGPLALLVSDAPSGQSLRQMIEKKRKAGSQPLSLRGAYNIIASVCNLLTYAHGVLPHGALCPEFIDVSGAGQVRVGGLGIGRFVPPGHMGTALGVQAGGSYLAPERHAGGPASAAADVYAVGAILYECLTLRPAPQGAEAERARPSAHNREVPAPIDGIVCRCMRMDPEARFAGPQALKEALAAAVENVGKNTSSHRVGSAGSRPATVAGIPALEIPSTAPPKISVQMPAVVAPAGPAPVAPPRPVRPSPSLAAPADAAGEAAQHMAHTPVKGSPKVPPLGPPSNPRSLGPPGFPVPPPPLGGLSGPSGPRPAVGLDEDAERFLIQKEDKMTYGPFAMREIRSQIEKGTITADHVIEDQETSDRRRVREHPLLGEMSREWEGKHAQTQMELRVEAERARHRASVQKSLSGIFIVVLLIGAGVAGYFKFVYKPAIKTVVVKEQGDDFFKGVEIAMKVDPPVKKERHKGPAKRVLKNGKWVDEVNLGDASNDGGDETLSADQVQGVMNRNFKLLGGCLREEASRNPETKKLDLEFQILGNGTVGSVKVNGETGSTAASCVFAKMQAVQFPKFNGTKTHAAFSLALK